MKSDHWPSALHVEVRASTTFVVSHDVTASVGSPLHDMFAHLLKGL